VSSDFLASPRAITGLVIGACWGLFLVVWTVGALLVRTSKRRETLSSLLRHRVPVTVGAVLLTPLAWKGPLGLELIPDGLARDAGGAALVALGVAFAVWARVYLGANWSGNVTLKESHELIQGGPYRLVRHPIYTGIGTGLIGIALWQGRLSALVGVAFILAGFAVKIRLEERWLSEEFGEQYSAYRERVKAVIPFVV
jgi:protein-S-isoprenylcysteine O-methyltransferase Ste14